MCVAERGENNVSLISFVFRAASDDGLDTDDC